MIVLDTAALLAYARSESIIGLALAQISDDGDTAVVADTCFIEAYSLLDYARFDMLDLVRAHHAVRISLPAGDDLSFIGGMAARTGNLAAGHSAYLAVSNGAVIYTDRAEQIRTIVGKQWPIEEIG